MLKLTVDLTLIFCSVFFQFFGVREVCAHFPQCHNSLTLYTRLYVVFSLVEAKWMDKKLKKIKIYCVYGDWWLNFLYS